MDNNTLERFQLIRHFEDWILGRKHIPEISRKEIFHDDVLSERQWKLRISIDSKFMLNHIDEIKKGKDAISEWINRVFEQIWQKRKTGFWFLV